MYIQLNLTLTTRGLYTCQSCASYKGCANITPARATFYPKTMRKESI